MATRPVITVHSISGKPHGKDRVTLPGVFQAPIRPDVVQFVHTNMNKNHRQAYAVSDMAGSQCAAESWGTGRAVARIPRVHGSGTHRAGQGAFGNMCRGGRMFNPTKVWRRWHRKININQRRFAMTSAIAASGIPALVMARGHRIGRINEVPLVVSNELEAIKKTRQAIDALKKLRAYEDVEKVKSSRTLRRGKGKARNRRWTQRRGPLVIYNKDLGVVRAFRNLPGVETCCVSRLNLLQLAPGGHLGRFCIWTMDAFNKLAPLYGSLLAGAELKTGYHMPHSTMGHADLHRIFKSEEIQSAIRPRRQRKPVPRKRNPLVNLKLKCQLNPFMRTLIRDRILAKRAAEVRKAELRANPVKPKASKLTKEQRQARNKLKRVQSKRRHAAYRALHA